MLELFKNLRIAGLRARLLGVVLLGVVPLVALLFVYASIENRAAQDRARADVQIQHHADVRSIQDLIAQSRATLLTFGITYAIQARNWTLAQGNAERLQGEHPEYGVIAVADQTGRIMVSSKGETGTVNVSREPFFERAVRSKQLTVSDWQVDPVTGKPAIVVSYPVYDENGKLIAVEYITFGASQFRGRVSPTGTAESVVDLIDSAGTLVARAPAIPGLEGKRFPAKDLAREILTQKDGTTTATGADGVTREYFFSPVVTDSSGGLYLTTGFAPTELLAQQRRTFGLTLAAFAGVALLALFAGWALGTYSVYVPARSLERAAEKLSAGDLTARADVHERNDEFGALGREFNSMADSIEHQVEELETARGELATLNEELEDRVRRRTAELEASNKELEAFSYSVSHDLRSPLRAIDGFSQSLLEDHAGTLDDDGRDDLRRVREAAKRMGELIDSLLMLSRLNRQEMRIKNVDLSAMAEEVSGGLLQADPERDVTVTITPGILGRADPALVRIVLENLLGNAWKFTSKHDSAHIEFGMTDVEGEKAYFVRDDGAGFDMAYADKLFGAFQRVHGQKDFPGVGIGLATTARIVHRHGGRIWAEGRSEKGATFYFTLC